MSLKTSIVLSKTESNSVEVLSSGMAGFRVDIAVVNAANIDTKIFIMQRDVLTLGSAAEGDPTPPYEDTFYSVASVGQMELVPEAPTDECPFYRVSSISLVFEAVEDLQAGVAAILELVSKLQDANDLAINMQSALILGFPQESVARFWGITTETTVSDEILLTGSQDYEYAVALDKVITNSSGPRYVYFAYPATLDDITTFQIGGVDVAVTPVTRDVETVADLLVSYKIYRTDDLIDPGSLLISAT